MQGVIPMWWTKVGLGDNPATSVDGWWCRAMGPGVPTCRFLHVVVFGGCTIR